MNTISVIIPVYNAEKYIGNCIGSILKQSCSCTEIIVVDDGSTDKSIEIAERLLSASNIDYRIVSQENQGVAVARNHGIALAKGEWVIAIDSDDCIDKDTFRIVMENIGENDVAMFDFIVNGKATISNVNEKSIVLTGKDAIEGFYSRKYRFIAPASLIRKSFLEKNGIKYDEACKFAEDDLYVWKVLSKAEHVLYVNMPLYHYIFHSNSTMTSPQISKFLTTKNASEFVEKEYVRKSRNAEGIKEQFLYRHYLGILHAVAKIHSYDEFYSLIKYYELPKLYRAIHKKITLKEKMKFLPIVVIPRSMYRIFKIL